MKKLIPALFLFAILLASCGKENHTIRFRNNYSQQINHVQVGSATIGDVQAGSTSDYHAINTGNFTISGTSTSGQALYGSGSISGKGKHKWTVTLTSAGLISMAEDK